MWLVLLVLAVLGLPVVVVALVANHLQGRARRALEAARPAPAPGPITASISGATAAELVGPRGPAMVRTSWPLRLACLRALLVAGALAFPAAFLASGRSGLTAGHVVSFVLAAHAGLGVAAASWFERRAASRGGSPGAAALRAASVAVAVWAVGSLQAIYTSHVYDGGGAAAGFEALQLRLDAALRAPARSGRAPDSGR